MDGKHRVVLWLCGTLSSDLHWNCDISFLFAEVSAGRNEDLRSVDNLRYPLTVPFSSLYLLPSILFLFLFSRNENNLHNILINKKTWMVLFCLLILLVGLVLYIRKYNWFVFSYFIPILHGGYTGPNYTLFSPPIF